MNTKEKIHQDYITAVKAKDAFTVSVMRMIRAAIKQVEIDTQKDLDEEGVMKIVTAESKKLKDAMAQFAEGGREDLVEQNEKEIAIIAQYLPEQMSDEDLLAIVAKTRDEMGVESPADFGKLMGAVMKSVGGKADGTRVSEMVKKTLS